MCSETMTGSGQRPHTIGKLKVLKMMSKEMKTMSKEMKTTNEKLATIQENSKLPSKIMQVLRTMSEVVTLANTFLN